MNVSDIRMFSCLQGALIMRATVHIGLILIIFLLACGQELLTPQWTFKKSDLKRFEE